MRNLYKVLIVLVILGAGAAYYAKRKNIDLKSLFSSKCDCHTGCDLKKSANLTTPASTNSPMPEPVKTPVAPAPHANTTPAATPAANSTSTPAKLAPNVTPANSPAKSSTPAK